MDFTEITDDDIVEYLLYNLFMEVRTINTEWSEKVPEHILKLTQQLMKELEQC